jgi:hypothetical protein
MTSAADSCRGCGYAGGTAACKDLFNDVALRVRALAWTDSLKTWRLMHDVYDIQHEEDFCGRYAGLVMHLGGVCWAIEHGGSERGYRALQQLVERDPWQGIPYPPEPGIPKERGNITVATLATFAYAALQPLAREWVQQALALVPAPRR